MGRELDYSPEQVTQALVRLVLEGGDVAKTAETLIGESFMVPAEVLYQWMTDTHVEQYKRLQANNGRVAEQNAVAELQATLAETTSAKRDLIERVRNITREENVPSALRAIADAEAKTVNSLLALTGRPVDGRGQGNSVTVLVQNLVDRGLVSLAPGVTLDQPPKPVANIAESGQKEREA